MEQNVAYDPYNYVRKWPVIGFKPPFLLKVLDGAHQDASTSLNFKLPISLDETITGHCRIMGVSRSEWIRNALSHVLSLEQQWLDDKRK